MTERDDKTPKRVTIYLPDDVADRIKGVDNVSEFFTEAVRAQDTQLRTEALLRRAEGDVSEEVRQRVRDNVRAQLARAEARRAARRLEEAQVAKLTADERARAAEQQLRHAA